MKVCSKCHEEKDEKEFNKQKNGKDELRADCKDCCKLYIKNWRENNKNKVLENFKEYRQNNKDKIKERNKKYRIINRVKLNDHAKELYKNNKERFIESSKIYRELNREIFVVYRIKRKYGDLPEELIDLKVAQLQLARVVRNNKEA